MGALDDQTTCTKAIGIDTNTPWAENKNTCYEEGRWNTKKCLGNTVDPEVSCAAAWPCDRSLDTRESYNGLVGLMWQYYDEAHNWGMSWHNDEGPIVWPANGYTAGGPPGFHKSIIGNFYAQRGGPSLGILPDGDAASFAIAWAGSGFLGVAEKNLGNNMWEPRLYSATSLEQQDWTLVLRLAAHLGGAGEREVPPADGVLLEQHVQRNGHPVAAVVPCP